MDGGSQRRFVTADAARNLQCHFLGEKRTTLSAFGEDSSFPKVVRWLELLLKIRYEAKQIRVEAVEVSICNGTSFSLPHEAFHGIDISIRLADDARHINGNDNIDRLIGSEYYRQVAPGRIRRLSNGLAAIKTLFGWTLQGSVESFMSVS